jgi:hypothetical protein
MNCLVVGASSRATAEKGRRFALERIKKCCSHSVRQINEAVFLGLGIVSTQSQVYSNLLLRQSLAQTQKSSLRMATTFFKPL